MWLGAGVSLCAPYQRQVIAFCHFGDGVAAAVVCHRFHHRRLCFGGLSAAYCRNRSRRSPRQELLELSITAGYMPVNARIRAGPPDPS